VKWKAVDLLDPDGIHARQARDALPGRRLRGWLTPSEVALYVRCPELHRLTRGSVHDEAAVQRGQAAHHAFARSLRRPRVLRIVAWSLAAVLLLLLARGLP